MDAQACESEGMKAGPLVGRPSPRAAARLAGRFPSFIGVITPSRDTAIIVAELAANANANSRSSRIAAKVACQ